MKALLMILQIGDGVHTGFAARTLHFDQFLGEEKFFAALLSPILKSAKARGKTSDFGYFRRDMQGPGDSGGFERLMKDQSLQLPCSLCKKALVSTQKKKSGKGPVATQPSVVFCSGLEVFKNLFFEYIVILRQLCRSVYFKKNRNKSVSEHCGHARDAFFSKKKFLLFTLFGRHFFFCLF